MRNLVKVFEKDNFKVRTIIKDNEIWFVGKDVAEALGYSDTNKAVAMHVDDEDKQLNDKTSSSFGQRGATIINESGLYSLVLSFKLPTAKEFKRWVTSEVLPLPVVEKKTYSASEIGKILGVSANKIGKLANSYNLKTEQYGKYFYDKSKYSSKEVETFRYYNNAINVFKELLI